MRPLLLAVLSIAALLPAEADACSCQAPGPPCSAMFSSTVFVGKVKASPAGEQAAATTTFELVETLHSTAPLGPTVEVRHSTIGSICGLRFEPGRTYVVYAHGTPPSELSAGACTRTHVLRSKDKDEDVAFARALPKRTQALVEGRLSRADGHEGAPIADVEVGVADAGVSAKTNATGAFSLMVPPGTWRLEVRSDVVTAWDRAKPVVSLPHPAACATPSIAVQWNGRLEGRVTSADGTPVGGVEVHALAKQPDDRRWMLSDVTAADGTFEIGGAAPGEYLIAISPDDSGGPSPGSPWPTTWAPGVADLTSAKTYTLSRAGRAGPIALVAPPRLKTVAVQVVVKRAGQPVKGAVVSLEPLGANRSTGGLANEAGVWRAVEFAGQRVKLRVCDEAQAGCVVQERSFEADTTVEIALGTKK